MPEEIVSAPSFHGSFRYGIDGSRRVMIPAKWRPQDVRIVLTAVLWPINAEDFLLVLPPDRWNVMLDKLKNRPLRDKRAATLERVLGATSAPLLLDKVGRFALPEDLAKRAGIEKEVEFVGRLTKFEMWSPDRYQIAIAQDKSVAAEMAEEVDL
jgi:MraZ protein